MSAADDIREVEEADAAHNFATFLGSLQATTEDLEEDPGLAAAGLEDFALTDAAALLQDLIFRLSLVARDLVSEAGKRHGRITGELSDGRQFKLERSADRKEWRHDDWQHDVRRVIAQRAAEPYGGNNVVVLMGDDGEVYDLPLVTIINQAIAEAQAVHGSQAPKTTSGLTPLGLRATDYCTSTPGGWRLSVVKPDTTPSTKDTKEKKTDG